MEWLTPKKICSAYRKGEPNNMIWILLTIALLVIFIISTVITVVLDIIGFFTFSWFVVLALVFMISAVWFAVEVLRWW